MNYEEALGRWGARKLGADESVWPNVLVDIDVDPGYACCGGRDPDCYCSFATPPKSEIKVKMQGDVYARASFDLEWFGLNSFVAELFEIANVTEVK